MNISPNNKDKPNHFTISEGNLTTPSPGKLDSIASIKSGKSTGRRSTVSSKGPSARTKGLNFNVAISPAVSTTSPPVESSRRIQSSHSDSHANYLNQSSTDDLKYDLQIPLPEKLYNLDIEEQLRLLALKEMSIVETKDSISDLTNKLRRYERELHQLREVIQRSLYREINASGKDTLASNLTSSNNAPQRRNSANPREEAIASTKSGGSRRRNISVSSIGRRSFEAETEPHQSSDNRKSKIWTNLSKPLTLIQQFDNMLQNEFERSLIPNIPTSEEVENRGHFPRSSQDSNSTSSSMLSPLKFKVDHSKSSITNLDELNYDTTHDSVTPKAERTDDDMFQAVSTSLWSFVNDVKQNVLASLGEEKHSINNTDLGENQTASQSDIEQGDSSGLTSSMSEMHILTDEQPNHIKDTDFEANNSDYDSNNDAENTVRLEEEKQAIFNAKRKLLN